MRPGPSRPCAISKPRPFAEQHVRRGHADVFEKDFGRPIRHAVESEHRDRPQHLHARRIHRHQDHRLLPVAIWIIRIGLAHEDADLAARVGGVRRVPLAAVDDVVVAVADDRTFDVGGVAGGHRRFGHRETGADFACQQRLQPLFPDAHARCIARQHFHIAGIRRRAVEHLGRQMRPAHHLAQRRVFEVGQPGAMFAFRQEQIPQARFARLRLQLLDDRIDLPRA